MKIIFIKVIDNQQKLHTICKLAYHHFLKKTSLYILTQTHLVAQYIDDLLWKHPPDCFLPHGQDETFEKILIGIEEKKSEFFEYILNLTEQPLINQKCCIYELWDETHPSKRELSEKKLLQYQAKGFEITHTTSEAIVVNMVNT